MFGKPHRTTDDRADGDLSPATPGTSQRLVALFRGEPPAPGAAFHDGMLVGLNTMGRLNGDARTRVEADRSLTEHDRVIELDAPLTGAGEGDARLWLLVRDRPIVPGARLLVVEDNEISGDYYREVLGGAGAEVTVASTAAAALELAAEHTFDLSLVDVRLPDANGYELCRLLGWVGSDRIVPTLLMSADPTALDPARVTSVGASGFVVNPVRPDELVQTVAAALGSVEPSTVVAVGRPTNVGAQQAKLRLFGRAAAWSTGGWNNLPAGRSADILATLAATCPQSVPAERLSKLVWERNLTVSANAMYTAISRLRRQLEGSVLDDAVVTDGLGYRLAIDPESIDLVAFERRAQEIIQRRDHASSDELGELLGRWAADPFAATGNELLVNWRYRLQELKAQANELLAVRLIIGDRAGEAAQLCRELVIEEPWRESAWSLLIVALYRGGRQSDALTAHRAAVHQLRRDLGLDPGPGLASLEMSVLQHDDLLLDDAWLVNMAASLNRRRAD